MRIDNNSILVVSEAVNSFPIHNGIYIHHLECDEYFTIEEGTATYIWTQLDGKKDLNQIFMEVAKLCRVNLNDIQNDLMDFVYQLLDKQMIQLIVN